MKSPLEQFDILTIKILSFCNFDLTVHNIYIPFICILFCIIVYIIISFEINNLIPLYVFNVLFLMYTFLITLIKQQTGNYGLFWLPFIFHLFNFILCCNLISLLPFGIALTSQFILIFWLSCTICASIFLIGLLRFNLKFLHIFITKSPFLLLFLLIPIEIFSYLIRVLSLAIRLAANIIAGHTLVHILIQFFSKLLSVDKSLSFIFFLPLIFIITLEISVAFLQAYVFTVLFCIYIRDTSSLDH